MVKQKDGLQVGQTQVIDQNGNVLTNSSTASSLQTPRNITLSGSVSGSGSFDGSQDITIITTGGGGSAEITQTDPVYLASGGSTSLTGKAVINAYEQIAGQTFNLNYNTEGDYVQENTSGTDLTSGAFVLSNSGGGGIDSYTKLLIHADGVNGSTEIVDNRGITPFGTHCGYFNGTAYYTIPTSHKMAFGQSQSFTIEGWFRLYSLSATYNTMLYDGRKTTNAAPLIYLSTSGAVKFNIGGADRITSGTLATVGNWYHVAVVRTGGVTTLYLNGVSQGTWSDTNNYPDHPIYFGVNAANLPGSTTEVFTGWLSNWRVSKIARYTANFTPPTSEFTNDADAVFLFKFDDGHGSQMLRDYSKKGHGALSNSVFLSVSQSKFGSSSLRVSSTGGYLDISQNKLAQEYVGIGNSDFTWDFWIRLDSIASNQNISQLGSSGWYGPAITFDSASGQLKASLSSNGTSFNIANGTNFGSISANTWTHIAMTRSGSNVYCFVNGVLGATIAVSTSNIFYNSQFFRIGAFNGTGGFVGYVDEFRVQRAICQWTSGFTPSTSPYTTDKNTVLLFHFEGAQNDVVILDSSESSYGSDQFSDTTIPALTFANNAALSSAQTRGGHVTSLALNGTNQYASITYASPGPGHPIYFSANEYFCFEAWFYINSISANQTLFRIEGSTSGNMYIYLPSTGTPRMYPGAGGSEYTIGPAATSGWNHIAWVYDSRGWVAYVNGVQGTYLTGILPTMPVGNLKLIIGGRSDNIEMTNGYLDSFRLTHGKPRYTANFTPGNLTQDDDTALLWEFNGSVGQTWVKELSTNTALIAATNARMVRDGVWITPTYNGTTVPTLSTTGYKFGTSAMSLNGTSDVGWVAPIMPFASNTPWTIDFWAKPNNFDATRIICGSCSTSGVGGNYAFTLRIDTSGICWLDTRDGSGVGQTPIQLFTMTAGTLKHYSVECFGTSYLYASVDGAMTYRGQLNGFTLQPAFPFYIGYVPTLNSFNGILDEFRVSIGIVRHGGSNFTVPAIPYGQQYSTGPYYVTTSNTSHIDVSAFTSIDSTTFTESIPPGTSIRYAVSFDNRTTWKTYNGSSWSTIALNSSTIDSSGMTSSQLNTALLAWSPSLGTTIDVAAVLKTTNVGNTPSVDNIQVVMDKYSLLRNGTDYTITKEKATGTQTLTFTRIKSGNANHTFDLL